jgi:hypothetical protein
MSFKYPILFAVGLVPAAVYVLRLLRLRSHKQYTLSPRATALIRLTEYQKQYRILRSKRLVLRILAIVTIMILTILSTLPSRVIEIADDAQSRDILIGLDVSNSMKDSVRSSSGSPSTRNDIANDLINTVLKDNTVDRIGLGIFISNYFLISPIMKDRTMIYDFLELEMKNKDNVLKDHLYEYGLTSGSDGSLISTSARRLCLKLDSYKSRPVESKSIIFITDAVDDDDRQASELAYKDCLGTKIKFYYLTFGSSFGFTDEPAEPDYNTDIFAKIAKDSGGKAYNISTSNTAKKVITEISNNTRSTNIESKKQKYTAESYFPLDITAAVLIIAYLGLSLLWRLVI